MMYNIDYNLFLLFIPINNVLIIGRLFIAKLQRTTELHLAD